MAVGELHGSLLGEVGADHFLGAAEVGHFPIPEDGFAAGVEHIGLEGGREPLLLERGKVSFGAGRPEFGAGEEGLAVVVGSWVAAGSGGDIAERDRFTACARGEEDRTPVFPIHEIVDDGGPAVDGFPAGSLRDHSWAIHGIPRAFPNDWVLTLITIGVHVEEDEDRADVREADGLEGIGTNATECGDGEGDKDADYADGDEEFDEGERAGIQNGGEITPALPGTS